MNFTISLLMNAQLRIFWQDEIMENYSTFSKSYRNICFHENSFQYVTVCPVTVSRQCLVSGERDHSL